MIKYVTYILVHSHPSQDSRQLHACNLCCPHPDSNRSKARPTLTSTFCSNQHVDRPDTNKKVSHKLILRLKFCLISTCYTGSCRFVYSLYPASIFCKGIKLIISDEVGFQIFFPITNALHSIIRVAININRPT